MTNALSRIAEITDITAAIAIAEVEGVRSGFGMGSGLVDHPTAAGQKITAAGAGPKEPFTHWTDVPEQGSLPLQAMRGTHRLTWVLPMKLFVQRGDLEEARRALGAFPPRYIAAFANNLTLRGTVEQIAAMAFRIESDDTWAWLATRITVVERLNLATRA